MITSFRYASLRPYIETWRIRFSQKQDSIRQHFYLIFTLSPPTTRGQLQSKTSLYPRAEPLNPAVPVKKKHCDCCSLNVWWKFIDVIVTSVKWSGSIELPIPRSKLIPFPPDPIGCEDGVNNSWLQSIWLLTSKDFQSWVNVFSITRSLSCILYCWVEIMFYLYRPGPNLCVIVALESSLNVDG